MTLARHNPPGFSDDLTEENKIRWSEWISSVMDKRILLARQFYNATKTEEKEPTANTRITWLAFPRNLSVRHQNDRARWGAADKDRQTQDEYCEWSIQRDAAGKMVRIVFCNEGPEYYKFLADHQPDTLLQLYREHNPGVGIQNEDLFHDPDGSGRMVYNAKNKWNKSTDTGTIMHLIQSANTLAAQINIGADATIIRKRSDGTVITDRDELIRCGQFGGIERNSDPQIGAQVNTLARNGAMITIQDPVGLYIDSINWGLIQPPLGHHDDDLSQFWKWTRGTPGHWMRAEFEIPADRGYVLGDLSVRGNLLEFGGQLADIITIALIGRASDVGGSNQAEPIPCQGGQAIAASVATFKDSGTDITVTRLQFDCFLLKTITRGELKI